MKDITGQKFNMLTAIRFAERRNNETYWVFKCDCGKEKKINSYSVSHNKTNSCGCIHRNLKNLIKQRFGRLVVIGFLTRNNLIYWECRCDCGNGTEVSTGNLKSGGTQSCGCLIKEILKKQQKPIHGMSKSRPYRIWTHMKERCENKKRKDYKNYGGRGIKVCDRWKGSFEFFWEDMKEGYSDNLTIDRKNNNGNYEKFNCRWISQKEQGNNTRVNKLITYKGKTQTQSQWSDKLNIHRCLLAYRLKTGWSVPLALETPVLKYKIKKS